MKATRDNLFTDGARGSTRNMTITKRQSGRFVISARRGPNTKGLSPAQQKTKNKFLRAVAYAKATLENTEKAAIYTAAVRPDFTAYTLALADMLRPPKVHEIDVSSYQGRIGDQIRVEATDDFKVMSVQVAIYTMDNELVEKGAAVLEGLDWFYTATEDHIALGGSTIKATAKDIPGNEGSLQITL